MLDAMRDQTKLTGLENDAPVTKLNNHFSPPDEEEFIFVFMMVPGKDAAKLDQLQFLTVQRGHDLRTPMFVDGRELFIERGFCHV